MTPQEAQQIASAIFDSNFSPYFMRAMKQYFTDTGEGDFSNAPDPDVMTALRAAIGSTAPRVTTIPAHMHHTTVTQSTTGGVVE